MVILVLVLFFLCILLSYWGVLLIKEDDEEKQHWGVRRYKTEYDYKLVKNKNSIFIDVR